MSAFKTRWYVVAGMPWTQFFRPAVVVFSQRLSRMEAGGFPGYDVSSGQRNAMFVDPGHDRPIEELTSV